MTNILGISALYHDSAACLIRDGEIVAAAQEERFSRKKHDSRLPRHATDYCLAEAGITARDLDHVVFYDKPLLKFERIIRTHMAYAPRGRKSFAAAGSLWFGGKLQTKEQIRESLDYSGEVLFAEHHEAHAMSAFYPSPFQQAAVLTIDGVGEWATTSLSVGRDNSLEVLKEIKFPHSLGLLYSAFTSFTGFKVNSGEYKMMGLAPYGEPRFVDTILENLIEVREDGSFRLNMEYFDFPVSKRMTSQKFAALFGGPARHPESELTQREMDLSRSMQEVTELVVSRLARYARKTTSMKDLCLAGGVALNCVANGKLLREKTFENIWVQPAAGDAGGALGAALGVWHKYLGKPRTAKSGDSMRGSYLGPKFSDDEVSGFLNSRAIKHERLSRHELNERVADLLKDGAVVGWFQGRMEFGPRALGNRTILGDARHPDMQKKMNLKIKFREGFRPFAPAVLAEDVADWFDLEATSPYMLIVAPVAGHRRTKDHVDMTKLFGIDKLNVVRSQIPAVTHVDFSARVQTVHKETNPEFHDLLTVFKKRHGCAVLLNTSFNVRGEPPVCTPQEAFTCFMRTDMDYLVLGSMLLAKSDQAALTHDTDWQKEFALD
ncbi:MAG: carbamoyltransferase [Actinobacteria bacterium]|nr:carbamoyltransferase [Actinomycetota bacterium]